MSQSQCSCAEEAAAAWERIDNILETGLDGIIRAGAQTVDFSLQSQKCQAHSTSSALEIKDNLLKIYERLVAFIEKALAACTGPMSSSDTSPAEPANHRDAGLLRGGHAPVLPVIYVPTKMALGEHDMDVQQSQCLVLDVCCRMLTNFASVLQQVEGQESTEIANVDPRVLVILFHITKLVETASSTLHALEGDIR